MSTATEILRAVLPNLLSTQGQLTPLKALGQVYSSATVRSQFTPEVRVDLAHLDGQSSSTQPGLLLRLLRPTVVLEGGAAGRTVWAPAGEAPEGSAGTRNLVLLSTAVLGTTLLLGYALGRATS